MWSKLGSMFSLEFVQAERSHVFSELICLNAGSFLLGWRLGASHSSTTSTVSR